MDEYKTSWNESFVAGRDYSPLNLILIDSLLASLNTQPKTAVDFGCGTGDAAVKLALRGMYVNGFDWSDNALEKARSRAEMAHVADRTTFQELDLNEAERSGLESSSADLVLCKLVIAFLKDKKNFCKYVKDILNDTGTFMLVTPVLYKEYDYIPEDKPHIAVNYDEILALLRELFRDVQIYNHSYSGERIDTVTFLAKK